MFLLFIAAGAGAKVITTAPVAGTAYKIKCIATDHTGYLGDDGTTLQGRHATGTYFILEATSTANQYYLKSQVTGKYVNAAGVTSGSAITFDEAPSTYWTLDQTNANTDKHSWAIRPNGTAGVSLNNNGNSTATCPWMKVNVHNSTTQGCDLWTFDDGMVAIYEKPQFGGTVWVWNIANGNFDSEGKTSTATPGRENNMGPVYKFENVGSVTTAVNVNVDTSDKGGIWVIGSSSNVTSSIGRWAGSILVEDFAIASVNYSVSLKGTEDASNATVWTNGTLTFPNRSTFDMNDGSGQRWYIGENGVINTNFTSVTKGSRSWDLQIVVGDAPERTGATRVRKTLTKKVMNWGGNLSNSINSITVWYKNADGNLTLLDNTSAVMCDDTGITITYTGLGYDEKTPSLPAGQYIHVSATKADFLTPATGADDNAHWYLLTQTRIGESPVYDNGHLKMRRAASGTSITGQLIQGNEKYLVRFFENGTGLYDIQFATGNFITHELTTGSYGAGGTFNLYNINGEATHIGWNKSGYADIVDNNGAGEPLSYWESGQVTSTNGNNDWSLYPVEFSNGVTINYTLHSEALNTDYTGSYTTAWAGENTLLPTLSGVTGYTLANAVFSDNNGSYTLTADITFPFPVSNETVKNATGIESELGNSKWIVNDSGNIIANNDVNTVLSSSTQDNFKWYIYPSFSNGVFSFKIQHYATGKYIPAITVAQSANTANAAVEEAAAGSYYFTPCIGNSSGFSINLPGTIFLSINSTGANQNIWTWNKSGNNHKGSNLSFPEISVTLESVKVEFNQLKNATPFDIKGSIVTGPSEFKVNGVTISPKEINDAITAAQSVNVESIEEMENFIYGTNGKKIKSYLQEVDRYGELDCYNFTVKHQYNTIILSCPSYRPEGIKLYTCSAVEEDGTTLTLTEVTGAFDQNTPYIMEAPINNSYTIIGWHKNHQDTHTSGWLTGVLKDGGATVPADSYALAYQESTGKQGFFKTDGTVTCPQNKCYLTVPVAQAVKAFYFENNGEATGIEEIFGRNDNETVIYDLSGRRLERLQKGVNIVNGRKILVK